MTRHTRNSRGEATSSYDSLGEDYGGNNRHDDGYDFNDEPEEGCSALGIAARVLLLMVVAGGILGVICWPSIQEKLGADDICSFSSVKTDDGESETEPQSGAPEEEKTSTSKSAPSEKQDILAQEINKLKASGRTAAQAQDAWQKELALKMKNLQQQTETFSGCKARSKEVCRSAITSLGCCAALFGSYLALDHWCDHGFCHTYVVGPIRQALSDALLDDMSKDIKAERTAATGAMKRAQDSAARAEKMEVSLEQEEKTYEAHLKEQAVSYQHSLATKESSYANSLETTAREAQASAKTAANSAANSEASAKTYAGRDGDGYDPQGYDVNGFSRDDKYPDGTIKKLHYSRYGFDGEGYDRHGHDRHGWRKDQKDAKGHVKATYVVTGQHGKKTVRKNYNIYGLDKYGYDRTGHDGRGRTLVENIAERLRGLLK